MAMIGISIVALIFIAILACVVLAIAARKPVVGLLAGGLLLPFLFYVNVGVTHLEVPAPPKAASQSGDGWSIAQSGPGPASGGDFTVGRLAWRPIVLLMFIGALAVIGVLSANRHRDRTGGDREPWQTGCRRGGWGRTLALLAGVLLLGVVGMKLYWVRSTSSSGPQAAALSMSDTVVARQIRQQSVARPQSRGIDPVIENYDKPRISLDEKSSGPAAALPAEADGNSASANVPSERTLSFEEAQRLLEDEPAGDDQPQPAEAGTVGAAKTESKSAGGKQEPIAANLETQPTTAANGGRGSAPNITFSLKNASNKDLVQIQFDGEKLRAAGLSFHEVSSRLFDNMNGIDGLIRVNSNRRLIALSVEAAKRMEVDRFRFSKNGSLVPLQNIASLRLVSTDSAQEGPRPAWVDEPPPRSGRVLRQVVLAGEYSTLEECRERADVLISLVVWDHLQSLIRSAGYWANDYHYPKLRYDAEGRIDGWVGDQYWESSIPYGLARMGLGPDFIRRQIVPGNGEYVETVQRSVGPMMRLYTRLEFTPEIDAQMKRAWVASQQGRRVATAGAWGAGILGVVVLAWGLLKVDTLTKGYYSKRLFLGVPAAILGLVYLLLLATM
jgi:hypothetical protein